MTNLLSPNVSSGQLERLQLLFLRALEVAHKATSELVVDAISSSSRAQKKKKERQQQLLVDNQEELLARAEALKASADALAWKREWCVEGAEVVHETYGTGTVASVGAAWIWVRFDDRAVMKKAKSKVCCTARRDKRRALREGRMVWLCSQTLHLKLSKHLKF